MFDAIKRLLGRDGDRPRPYEELDPSEIVDAYARRRARLASDGWSDAPPGTVAECRQLMSEWERRGFDSNALDEAAQRVEDDLEEGDLEFFE